MSTGTPSPRGDSYPDVSDRSFGELFSKVGQDLSALMRQELELAKSELRQEARTVGKASGLYAGSGLAGHMVLLFVSIALWWGLSNLMDAGWAAVIVAAVWAIVGAALFAGGRSQMTHVRGLPRTIETVKEFPSAMHPDGGTHR